MMMEAIDRGILRQQMIRQEYARVYFREEFGLADD